jgi:uncharacterized protein YjbI with pentapeptide repeats
MSDNVRYEVRLKAVREAPPAFSGHLSGLRFDPSTTSTRFVKATFEDVDFSGLEIEEFYAQDSVFERCDFSGAKLTDGTMSIPPGSVYRDCRFDRAKLRFQDPGLARFERCSFDHTVIDHWSCSANDFVDCTFVGRFRDVQFSGGMNPTEYLIPGTTRHPNEFHGNDFSRARLVATDFTGGIDLDAQTLPSGPGYRRFNIQPETVGRVEALIPSLPLDEQQEARRLVAWFRGRYAGQQEVFTEWPPVWGFGLYEKLVAMVDVA